MIITRFARSCSVPGSSRASWLTLMNVAIDHLNCRLTLPSAIGWLPCRICNFFLPLLARTREQNQPGSDVTGRFLLPFPAAVCRSRSLARFPTSHTLLCSTFLPLLHYSELDKARSPLTPRPDHPVSRTLPHAPEHNGLLRIHKNGLLLYGSCSHQKQRQQQTTRAIIIMEEEHEVIMMMDWVSAECAFCQRI